MKLLEFKDYGGSDEDLPPVYINPELVQFVSKDYEGRGTMIKMSSYSWCLVDVPLDEVVRILREGCNT